MKYFFSLFFLLALAAGCKEKKSPEAELESKLMKTMNDFLVKNSKPGVAVTIKDIIYYYDEKKYYHCEFHVNLRNAQKDTTGTMVANISKDFNTVERAQ